MRISLNNSALIHFLISIYLCCHYLWLNLSSLNVPCIDSFWISCDYFFRACSLNCFTVFPYYAVNILDMTINKFNLRFQFFLVDIFTCFINITHVIETKRMLIIFNIMLATNENIFVIWRWRYAPYFWVTIINTKDWFLIYSIGVFWIVNQMNFIFFFKGISPNEEFMILYIAYDSTHASCLL